MRIVFIVHYFPPLNSSGARRVLALSKYLSRFGHQVTVVTTRKSRYDGQLTEQMPDYCKVIELGGRSVPDARTSIDARTQGGRPALALSLVTVRRALTRIFGQLIDHRLSLALRFFMGRLPREAVEALEGADVLVSSSPPWPVHLATYFASGRFGKPWVADYRDQFSGHHIFESNALTAYVERSLERLMLGRAARVTVVSSPMAEYYRQFHRVVDSIENGFDAEVFEGIRKELPGAISSGDGRKTLRYVGTITKDTITKDRIPNLLEALRLLRPEERKEILVQFYGESGTLPAVVRSRYPELMGCMEFNESVSHREALTLILTADGLFFSGVSSEDSLSAKGVLTTKLFEYLAAQRPILADIVPQTLAGQVITRSGLGLVCSTDPGAIAAGLRRLLSGDVGLQPDAEFIGSFSRESQAKRFEKVLEAATGRAGR